MAKPQKDRDRRAVIEQMRRDQQRSERRRTLVIIAACVVVGLVIVGAAAVPLIRQSRLTSGPLTELGASASAASCQDVKTAKATGNQQHMPEGTPIPYTDGPPASGPHYSQAAPFDRKFYTVDDRPEVPFLVHNLEHGYNILWYDETVAEDDDQLAIIKAIASKFEGSKLTDKFIAAPWTKDDGKPFPKGEHVALTHWSIGGKDAKSLDNQQSVWLYCSKPSGAVVADFVKKYPFSDSPEPRAM